ncbi:MAG: sugar-transfer associated ATP-grasp domain-containing protein, partial [Candidatus Cloacimonetes bacterium]|nr:sugar-transfer associated ATP-grasp domain-containing protein [Candidatus Cloacimonadota bacterium]
GIMFRMGRGEIFVDNMFSGGIAAPVDDKTGIICGPAVTIDPTEDIDFDYHPISKVRITGAQLPYWKETLELISSVSEIVPGIKSVGWDVAITENGPLLVEGNVPWGIFGLQLPYQKGRMHKILPYLDSKQVLSIHRKYQE